MTVERMFIYTFIVFVQVLRFSNGKPFFLNHTSVLTSLLGASSSPASSALFNTPEENPYSENIAIIPNKKLAQQQQNDTSIIFPDDDTPSSTPPPSLLRKKFEKIVRKIVTVSQIKQALQGHLHDNNGFQYPNPQEIDAQDIRISKEYGAPLKIDLNYQENKDDLDAETDSAKVAPSNLGVYILELFAQLIGLTIGAANHISHSFSSHPENRTTI